MKSKLPLSIVVILNKKADNPSLKKMEESLKFAEEILLIDTGEKPVQDFSKVRNQALAKAKYDWVLFVDSDEVISSGSAAEIEKIILEDEVDLVFVRRKDIFLGKVLGYGEVGNLNLIRLGKKSQIKFERPVHEVVEIKSFHKVFNSKIVLWHYAHQNIEGFFKKIKYYASQEAQYKFENKIEFKTEEILFFPPGKFILNFFFKLGFLDGYRGFVYAIMMSLHSLLVRVYLLELNNEK
jgi:glycosyltransferase involved in cell wall biosynthesis